MNKTGILWITGLLCLILVVFWPSDSSQPTPQNQAPSSGQATSSGQQAEAPSSGQATSSGQQAEASSGYRKVETRELDVGVHVIELKAGVKSETFTFAKGVKGSSTQFASNGCRKGFANGHPPVTSCGTTRGRLAPEGENLVSFAYQADEDTQVVITVR